MGNTGSHDQPLFSTPLISPHAKQEDTVNDKIPGALNTAFVQDLGVFTGSGQRWNQDQVLSDGAGLDAEDDANVQNLGVFEWLEPATLTNDKTVQLHLGFLVNPSSTIEPQPRLLSMGLMLGTTSMRVTQVFAGQAVSIFGSCIFLFLPPPQTSSVTPQTSSVTRMCVLLACALTDTHNVPLRRHSTESWHHHQ